MNAETTLAAWALHPDPSLLTPATLRLAHGVAAVQRALDPVLSEPLERALAGLGVPPDWQVEPDPDRMALAALCAAEAGAALDLAALRALEARVLGTGAQVLVARARVLVDPDREREARRALASQDLPYVMPGVLHPLQVEILAGGDRVLPALHVDHVRKLSALAADALPLDARALGLWFWPVLRTLAVERLRGPLKKLVEARRLPPGGRGLAAAYLLRLGAEAEATLPQGEPADRLLLAVAALGDRSAADAGARER